MDWMQNVLHSVNKVTIKSSLLTMLQAGREEVKDKKEKEMEERMKQKML